MENIIQEPVVVSNYQQPKFIKWFYVSNVLILTIILTSFYFFTGNVGIYTGWGSSNEWIYNIWSNFLLLDTLVFAVVLIVSLFLSIKNKNFKLFLISLFFTVIHFSMLVIVLSNSSDGLAGSIPTPNIPTGLAN